MERKKKRVLHVIASMGGGGAEAVLHNLWPSLCRSDQYEFEICLFNSYGHFGEKLASEGAIIHCLGSILKYDPRTVQRLRRLVKRGSFSVVHAHLFPELYAVALATIGMKNVELVYTEHRSTNRRRKFGSLARALDRLAYQRYRRVISVSASTEESLVAWQPQLNDRSIVIPNCVRRDNHKRLNSDGRKRLLVELGLLPASQTSLILFAGRLHHQKGADVLISALSQLKRRDYLCLIAGQGDDRTMLEAMVGSLGLNDRVRFLGFRSDLAALLGQVDFMVLPSRYEGMPIVILEAMAAGCPIVATRVDGIAELLRNEESALLVGPEDDEELANAIQRLLGDAMLGSALAAKASLDAEAYLAENAARRLLDVYDRLLGGVEIPFERGDLERARAS